jgi:hypothetical protein
MQDRMMFPGFKTLKPREQAMLFSGLRRGESPCGGASETSHNEGPSERSRGQEATHTPARSVTLRDDPDSHDND